MTKKRTLLILSMLLSILVIKAQTISIHLVNEKRGRVYLHSLSGEKITMIDSMLVDENGNIFYNAGKKNLHSGIYRWILGENKWLDFIYDGSNIGLKSEMRNLIDSMKVINSESNRLFYSFIKLNRAYKLKIELLYLILARYPEDDEYYNQTKKQLAEIQNEYVKFVNVTSQVNPNSFVAKYIRSAQLPVIDLSVPAEKHLDYLKKHGLDNVDFSNPSLINSDLFTNKSIEYLTYFRNPNLPKELLEKEFISAVDSLLARAKVHTLVYRHVVEYLIDGFKKFGFDQVVDYMVQNYVIKDDLCLDSKTENAIQRRLDQARKLPIGTAAPNIILPNENEKEIDLSKITSEKVLVLFYASWCPHCQTLIPQLHELYKNQKEKKYEVLAIALDNKKEEWKKFVTSNKLIWLNVCDLKGWDTKSASDYFIYATPTMFLINKQMKILAKPITLEEAKTVLTIH